MTGAAISGFCEAGSASVFTNIFTGDAHIDRRIERLDVDIATNSFLRRFGGGRSRSYGFGRGFKSETAVQTESGNDAKQQVVGTHHDTRQRHANRKNVRSRTGKIHFQKAAAGCPEIATGPDHRPWREGEDRHGRRKS